MITVSILFSIAAINLIWTIIITFVSRNPFWLLSVIISFCLSIIAIAAMSETPTDSDVRKGKANYIEKNHIEVLNGDTINTYKTYSIEWNKENTN